MMVNAKPQVAKLVSAVMLAVCVILGFAPSAWADEPKPDSVILQIDNFTTSKGIDVVKEVASIDVSKKDTSINLTVKDRYSGQADPRNRLARVLYQVDSSGKSTDIQVITGDKFTFTPKSANLKAKSKVYLKVLSNMEFDSSGNVVGRTEHKERYTRELNMSLTDSSAAEPTSSFSLGSKGFSYTFSDTPFKFVNGTTISLSPITLPVSYKHKSDGTTIVGIGCDAEDTKFYQAVKNRNVWQKYSSDEIVEKLKAIDKAWMKNKLGGWGKRGIDWSLFGYAEFNTNKPDEKWTVTLCGRIGVKFEGHAQYFIFTGDATANIGGELTASLTRYPKTQTLTGALQIGAYGNLELYVGLGCQYIASIGVYGSGGIHAGLDLLPTEDFGFNDVYVNGELGVKAKAFGFTVATWKILSGKKDLYSRQRPSTLKKQSGDGGDSDALESEDLASGLMAVDADAVYPEVPRDYLDKGFAWNGKAGDGSDSDAYPFASAALNVQDGGGSVDAGEEDDAFTIDPLVDNTYSETDVHTASSGEHAIMVFVADANQFPDVLAKRESVDRGVIVYSRYNARYDEWSKPVPVLSGAADDGCADYAPCVRMDEDGTAYIGWLSADTKHQSDSTIGEVAGNLDVNVASVDANGVVKAKKIETNIAEAKAPSSPQICLSNGRPAIAWFTNDVGGNADDSQVIGLSGAHDIGMAQLDAGQSGVDGSWTVTSSTMLDENGSPAQGAVTSFAIAEFDGVPTCAWTLDTDYNAESGNEIVTSQVYRTKSDGGQVLVANEAANARFAKKADANVLTFYQDGSIKSIQAGSDDVTVEFSGTEGNALPSPVYKIIGDLSGRALVAYAVAGDGTTGIDAQVLKDGVWSAECEVANQKRPITYFSMFYMTDPDDANELVPVFVYSSENNSTYDKEGDGSASLYSMMGGPLMQASITDVNYDDFESLPAGQLPVELMVTNSGSLPIDRIDYGVRCVSLESVVQQDTVAFDAPLQPGETTSVNLSLTLPAQSVFNEHEGLRYKVMVLPSDARLRDLARLDETTTTSFQVGAAHLSVDADHLLADGQESIKAVVTNGGMAQAAGTLVFENTETGAEIARASIPALQAHESFTYTCKAANGLFAADGIKQVSVRVEGTNVQEGSIASHEGIVTWVPSTGGVVGEQYSVKSGVYTVTGGTKATVEFVQAKRAKAVAVPAKVKINGKAYKVTSIAKNAFANAKNVLVKAVIGKNVKKIAPRAFAKCTKLSTVVLKTKKLTKRSVKNCFKSVGAKNVTVKVKVGSKKLNKKYAAKYRKFFTKANCGAKVSVKA